MSTRKWQKQIRKKTRKISDWKSRVKLWSAAQQSEEEDDDDDDDDDDDKNR